MSGDVFLDLDREPLSSDECSTLVHNGSTGRLAFFGEDGRIELLNVRYAVDAGSVVCYVPATIGAIDRAVPVTFEAYGEGATGPWTVVLKGRGRRITRDTDVAMVELLLCRAPGPGEVPLRLMADTISGTRASALRPLNRSLQPH